MEITQEMISAVQSRNGKRRWAKPENKKINEDHIRLMVENRIRNNKKRKRDNKKQFANGKIGRRFGYF